MAARPERDQGMAMLMVIGIMAVLTVFLLTSLGLALSNAPASPSEVSRNTVSTAMMPITISIAMPWSRSGRAAI